MQPANGLKRAGFVAAFVCVLGFSASGARAETLEFPDSEPILGTWDVYHNATAAQCQGMPLPIPAEGPDRVTIEDRPDEQIMVTGIDGQLLMQRVTAQRFESREVDGAQVIERVDPGEWALLAEGVGDSGLLYSARKGVGGGAVLAYLVGWLESDPDTLLGHLTMAQGPCQVLRSFRAER